MKKEVQILGTLLPLALMLIFSCGSVPEKSKDANMRPNILFVIADDQSFPHASAYGDEIFKTPAFDKVAKNGVLFNNAFVAAPQCSPSRAAILTGRNIWQLEEAGTHSSYFPEKFPVFTQVLESGGYSLGYTGKAWGPGNWKDAGWRQNPVGREYNEIRFDHVSYAGISSIDYAENFQSFLNDKRSDQPFLFWFGAHEPHRNYERGSGGKILPKEKIRVPEFLPQNDSIINDMLDYALEISWFDQQLEKMVSLLEERGELDNTIIVVTADNGMPFPYAKANLQEYGIHVPLAICGPSIEGNREVDDLVSLIDLAPTLLELTGFAPMDGVTGTSLKPILQSRLSGVVDTARTFILTGRERHTHARPDNVGYPARAIRTDRFLYIKNFKPELWPMGDPPPADNGITDVDDPDLKPITQGYEDIDDSPSKRVMIAQKEKWPVHFQMAFGKRAKEQLYDIQKDPYCMEDLSSNEAYAEVLRKLGSELETELKEQGDPRMLGDGDIFDTYPRFGRMRTFPGFRKRGEYAPALKSNEKELKFYSPPGIKPSSATQPALQGMEGPRPNIIFILADDLGWSSLSCVMDKNDLQARSDYHETPHLEKLAAQGMRFSRGYASASICSPSRRSILFGQTPVRQGDETFKDNYHPHHTSHLTIPQMLRRIDKQYRTAHFGKWDMRADFFPEDAGYDESDGNTGNRHGDVMTKTDDKWRTLFLLDDPKRVNTLAERAMNFMERQVKSGHPFFMQVSHYATHVDLQAREQTYEKYEAKAVGKKHHNPAFAGMLEDLDSSIGKILDRVESLGISDNTYIFFMADNGATEFFPPVKNRLDHPAVFSTPMRNHPLRGGKWTLYEGGIRVPFIVMGPGITANSQCDVPVAGWDLLPTFAELAGNKTGIPTVLDGGSLVGLLKKPVTGKINRPTRDLIFHRYNNSYPHSALIDGDYKVLKFWKSGKVELYNLKADAGEIQDIAGQNPEKAKELADRLTDYIKKVNQELSSAYK